MDEAGQPSSEPARVGGTGGGTVAGHTGAWRIVSDTGSLPQAEPYGPRWRSPAATDPRGGAEGYPRYEMVAPVSPAVSGERAGFDAGESDPRAGEIEQAIDEAERDSWSAPWVPAEHSTRPSAGVDDDMPVLARATAASQAAQQVGEELARPWASPEQPVTHARPTSAPPAGSGAYAVYGGPFGGPPPPGMVGYAAPSASQPMPPQPAVPQPGAMSQQQAMSQQAVPQQVMPQPPAAPQAAAPPTAAAGFAPAYSNQAPARPATEALGPVSRAAARASLPDLRGPLQESRGPLPEQRAAFQDPWLEQVAPERGNPGESVDAARDAAAAAQALSATQGALSRTRSARAHAVTDDFTAVGATFAAAHDARGELSEYEPPRGGDLPALRQVPGGGALPQRVPAAPDVPDVPDDEPEYDQIEQEPPAAPVASPELARIATHLRSDEDLLEEAPGRPDGFDMEAVIAAVRGVEGVREAQLRQNANGVHTLRLDLADGADGARVSREVARLLKQRMGLAAEPRRTPGAAGPPPPPGALGPLGQPRDTFPVAGAAPAPTLPMPASAAEHLGGPVAANAGGAGRGEERGAESLRRHAAPGLHGRGSTDLHSGPQAEHAPATPPLRRAARAGEGSRVVLDQVQVNTLGLDATVTVRLVSGGGPAEGRASGPSVDGYVLRLAAVAAASAVDQLLSTVDTWEQQRGRCFVEHAAVVPLGSCEVAVVVVLLACGGWVEQLSGAALVNGDPRQAIVRATLAAVNRRLDGLLG